VSFLINLALSVADNFYASSLGFSVVNMLQQPIALLETGKSSLFSKAIKVSSST
jgi:hypothetical protein